MRLLPRLLAVVAACAFFPAAHAACTAASIKGSYAAGVSGTYSYSYPTAGVAHVTFDGIKTVSVSSYKEGELGTVQAYTGTGTYTLDAFCRGSAVITLKQNGVAVGTMSLALVVSGTPTNPQIDALVSSPATQFTGGAHLSKIAL